MQAKVVRRGSSEVLDILDIEDATRLPRTGDYIWSDRGRGDDHTGFGNVVSNIVWKYQDGQLVEIEILVR